MPQTFSDCYLNEEEFFDRVLGCWTGKNIGGTLGAPFEGRTEEFHLEDYAVPPQGEPAPNDDLDLQLVWLEAVETYGISRLTPRRLGDCWLDFILAGWNEYGTAMGNLRNGIYPPLSGLCGNSRWGTSNGAWIRSEIWACLFPGDIASAARFAWMDACIDHYGDGIYAEIFMASLESAAFLIRDPRKLVETALSMIPEDCRIARSVRLVCEILDRSGTPSEARRAVMKLNQDIGNFQAPQNVAYVVIGLIEGDGDFGKSVCTAVNCGDDTDCTGATTGAIMGILSGHSGLPEKWVQPIGDKIRTATINPMHNNISIPSTLQELTSRITKLARKISEEPGHPVIGKAPSRGKIELPTAGLFSVPDSDFMDFELPWGMLRVRYCSGAEASPGDTLQFELTTASLQISTMDLQEIRWSLPETWSAKPECGVVMRRCGSRLLLTVTAGSFHAPAELLELSLTLSGRKVPAVIHLPIMQRNSFDFNTNIPNLEENERTEINHRRKIQ